MIVAGAQNQLDQDGYSYNTLDNYVATTFFFADSYTEPYGVITTADSASGTFSYGNSPTLPIASYNATNYWVDVTFAPANFDNAPPEVTSSTTFKITENTVLAATITAADDDNDPI